MYTKRIRITHTAMATAMVLATAMGTEVMVTAVTILLTPFPIKLIYTLKFSI